MSVEQFPSDFRFVVSDPDGVFLTLNEQEARALLTDIRDDDDLGPALVALRAQLEDWLT